LLINYVFIYESKFLGVNNVYRIQVRYSFYSKNKNIKEEDEDEEKDRN
jgi:hypothetical protein